MPYQYIELALDRGVASLTLNRPPLNLMNIGMMEEINSALLELRLRSGLKVLVQRAQIESCSTASEEALRKAEGLESRGAVPLPDLQESTWSFLEKRETKWEAA